MSTTSMKQDFIGSSRNFELEFLFHAVKLVHIYDTSQWFMFYSE